MNIIPLRLIYGQWHFAERHAIGFHYFRIDREGSALAVDRQFDALRINGVLRAQDKSSFYYLNYSYAFQSNEHLLVRGLFGIYTVDLDFQFEGIGEISINVNTVVSGQDLHSSDTPDSRSSKIAGTCLAKYEGFASRATDTRVKSITVDDHVIFRLGFRILDFAWS